MKTFASRRRFLAALLPLALAACGGDDGFDSGAPATCSVADQKAWLSSYFDDWYFWYRISPRPNPAGYATVGDYFNALLYTGTDVNFPADRWSFYQSVESFNRFFGDGESLGYGVSVAGNEVVGQPDAPLYVRYIEPLSPAAGKVARGDQVLSINGRSAHDVIAADDFSALSATNPGETLTLQLRTNGVDRTVVLTSAVFTLAPVGTYGVVSSPGGRKMGYVLVKDMISQVASPLDNAFASFQAAGVNEIVLDLRYNGGGLVSVGRDVASYVAGTRGNGVAYAKLLYNDKRAADYNQTYMFSGSLAAAAGVPRVFVLTGSRTCSASEQVVNGLRGAGVDVVTIGDTTCGKPVGFLPTSACDVAYTVVNFESVNARNEGRYFDGFDATCPVAEDFTKALGTTAEPLLAAAASYADGGGCPVAATKAQPFSVRAKSLRLAPEPGDVRGMIAR